MNTASEIPDSTTIARALFDAIEGHQRALMRNAQPLDDVCIVDVATYDAVAECFFGQAPGTTSAAHGVNIYGSASQRVPFQITVRGDDAVPVGEVRFERR